jgi:CubicO group peptidase (beta-lactamase class C family)
MSAISSVPESNGTIEGFTREGLAQLNAHSQALVNDGKIANVVTLIARHGELVNCEAYGVHDVSATPPVPVKVDSIFRIASMTKPITAAAMMILWEEGKWALEDPVSRFIPEFKDLMVRQDDGQLVPQATPMTMKQLMSHSAGFGARGDYLDLRNGDLQDMIDSLAKQPLSFQPGRGWRYGPSVDIQGYIIQKLTGQFLDEFFEQRIFAPLGMVDTGYALHPSKLGRLVSNHRYDINGNLVAVRRLGTFNIRRPRFLGGGGGLMLSTVKDYWRFSQMILNGGEYQGKRLLQPITVELMHTNVLEPGVTMRFQNHDLKGLGFGLGFAIVHDPVAARTNKRTQSYFWSGLFGTWFFIDPVNDMIVISFINNMNGSVGSSPVGAILVREQSTRLVYNALSE